MSKRGSYQSLTLVQKYEILQRLRNGESAVKLSIEFKIPRTSVNDIKKNGAKIEEFMAKMEVADGDVNKRKRMTAPVHAQLDEALFIWFSQQRSQGLPLSGPIVIEKALQINKELNGDGSFKASQGWLDKFKIRHGIRELDIEGEKLSADSDVVIGYTNKLAKTIQKLGLTREQVYNCDETGLNWKALPNKTLASMSETRAPGFKLKKERLTILVCANASGNHKLPLVVIDKSVKPRAFKNVNINLLPVKYLSQNSAWMTQDLFKQWFTECFVPQVKCHLEENNLPEKALLVLDNAPAHPVEDLETVDGNIKAIFLPANTSCLIQPMDQGVIESLKRHYRKIFLQSLIFSENETQVQEFWKKYTIKDAIYNISQAWHNISKTTLKSCWNNLWADLEETSSIRSYNETNNVLSELKEVCQSIPVTKNITDEELVEWIEQDANELGYEILSDKEIVAYVQNKDSPVEEDSNEKYVSSPENIGTYREIEGMLTKCIEWYERQKEAELSKLIVIRQIRQLAVEKEKNSLVQKKITHFFKK